MTEKVIKVKEYEWTNPKYGMVVKEWKKGNKILCRITRQGEGYRSGGKYLVDAPNSGIYWGADTMEEAESKAHRWMGWGDEWDNIIKEHKTMKGHRTYKPLVKKSKVCLNVRKMF